MFHVFLIIQVIITLAMVGLILLQRSDADGLSGLGGGGGGGNSLMTGRAAATFLSKATSYLAAAFMINSLWLAIMSTSGGSDSIADSLVDEISQEPAEITVPIADEEVVAPVEEESSEAVSEPAANESAPEETSEPVEETAPVESQAPVQEAAPIEESKPSVPTPE